MNNQAKSAVIPSSLSSPSLHSTYGLLDSGANGIYVKTQDLSTNGSIFNNIERDNSHKLSIADNSILRSTHRCIASFPGTSLHVPATSFDDLDKTLIGINQFCDSNNTVTFSNTDVKILDNNNKILIQGKRDSTTGLWYVPITDIRNKSQNHSSMAYQYGLSFINDAQLVKYVHMMMGSPSQRIFLNAIKKGFIKFPHLTYEKASSNKQKSIYQDVGHAEFTFFI